MHGLMREGRQRLLSTLPIFHHISHSAVAKIAATVSKRLESDKYLREQIKGLEAEYSFFKG
jgi:hypothetical protein